MCGIAGEVRFDGRLSDAKLVDLMARSIQHRGPDGRGLWSDTHVALAHQRLAIRDLTPAGAQPILSSDGMVVVSFNGEIYNDAELRAELTHDHKVSFHGHCDAEVIPAGYAAWGEALFDRLEGMFAIALWDARKHRFFLVRDGVGIKPLYYQWKDKRLLFGSEIKAVITATGMPDKLDPAALHAFLAQGYVGPTATLLPDIHQVPPGTWLQFSVDGIRQQRYWAPNRRGDINSMVDAQEAFAEVFTRVCRNMLVSDVPVGILQSAGIDSSLISLTLNDPTIPLFTASFSHGDYDESTAAQGVAAQVGSCWVPVPADQVIGLEEDLRRVIWHFDGQVADSSGLAFYRLAREMRRHITVALSGDGADEFFAGYETYCASRLAASLGGWIPAELMSSLSRLTFAAGRGSAGRYPFMQKVGRFLLGARTGSDAHAEWRRYAMPWDNQRLYSGEMRDLLATDPFAGYKGEMSRGGCLLDRCLLADQVYYLPADMLRKTDAMSMAHGLEVRVPFLDRRIMDFAGRLAPALISSNCLVKPKKFLRAAVSRLGCPPEIAKRRKTGFNVPAASLLRNELRPLAAQLFERRADAFAPYLDPGEVTATWQSHRDGRADHGYLLWALLTLGLWWRQAA